MLSAEMIAQIQYTITGSLGLMPFYDVSEIPKDAEWSRVTDGGLEAKPQSIEVYDLVWIEKIYEGHLIFKKWRVFVGLETNLPQRIEFYQKSTTDSEYNLKYIRIIEYLSDSEMKEVIKEASF